MHMTEVQSAHNKGSFSSFLITNVETNKYHINYNYKLGYTNLKIIKQ